MACLNPDGTLTSSAQAILKVLEEAPAPAAEIAQQARLPLYRVRSSLRELVQAGLLAEEGGRYRLTAAGRERL